MRNHVLASLAQLVIRHPRWVLAVALLLTVASGWITATHLTTNTDQDDLVAESLPFHHRYKEFLRDFGDQEYLYVMVETNGNRLRAQAFVDVLVAGLRAVPDVREVTATMDPGLLARQALGQLTPAQLQSVAALAQHPEHPLQQALQSRDLDDLLRTAAHWMPTVGAGDQSAIAPAFTAFAGLLTGMRAAADGRDTSDAPSLAHTLLGDAPMNTDGYLTVGHGKFLLVLIMPDKDYTSLEVIGKPLARIRAALDQARSAFPDVTAGLTGRPVLSADEMATTNRDMLRATLFALIAVTALLIAYFRRLTQPALVTITVGVGICWTYGLTTITIGSLNLISSVFAIILVGGGMEFGLHLLSRYREELALHHDAATAVRIAITKTGRANLTSALTTAAAFYCALFTDFLALRELGFIAGSGVLLCLLAMFTVLPALLVQLSPGDPTELSPTDGLSAPSMSVVLNSVGSPGLNCTHPALRGLTAVIRRPRVVLGVAAVITVGALVGMPRVRIDHNLLKLQATGLESVRYERRLMAETDTSTWQAAFVTDSADESAQIAARARTLPTAGRVESIQDIVPVDFAAKLPVITTIAAALQDVRVEKPHAAMQAPELMAALASLHHQLTVLANQALQAGESAALTHLESMLGDVDGLRTLLRSGDPAVVTHLGAYQQQYMRDYQQLLTLFMDGLTSPQTITAELPDSVLRRFRNAAGRHAVYVYPARDVWDPVRLARFVHELRTIDPHVTGVPVEVYESSRLLERSFLFIGCCAMGIIFLIIWIDLRSLPVALLATAPLLLGLGWLFGLMGLCGIPFTLANFFAVPMLIGLGVDSGAQIVHRVIEEGGYHDGILQGSTGTSILLTSLVCIASFGMLGFAAHRGIAGFGHIMVLGSLTIMLAALVVLPCLLRHFHGKARFTTAVASSTSSSSVA